MPCSSKKRRVTLLASFKNAVRYLVLVSVPLLPGLLQGGLVLDEDGWQQGETTAAGQIYHREVTGSPIPWVMIVASFKSTPERVHQLVTDYDHFPEFIPNVRQSRVLEREGNERWVYHHLVFPAPISDRAYVIKSTDSAGYPAQPYYRVDWQLDKRSFPGIDLTAGIRPEVFTGFWELRADAGSNTTVAYYAVHSEPGGFIPGWLVTTMTERYVQQVVDAVRSRLGDSE
jgi:hypothetical protein